MTRARPAARVIVFANEPEEGVRCGVNEVDSIVRAVRQVVLLRGIVDPTYVEAVGPIIGRGTLYQRNLIAIERPCSNTWSKDSRIKTR